MTSADCTKTTFLFRWPLLALVVLVAVVSGTPLPPTTVPPYRGPTPLRAIEPGALPPTTIPPHGEPTPLRTIELGTPRPEVPATRGPDASGIFVVKDLFTSQTQEDGDYHQKTTYIDNFNQDNISQLPTKQREISPSSLGVRNGGRNQRGLDSSSIIEQNYSKSSEHLQDLIPFAQTKVTHQVSHVIAEVSEVGPSRSTLPLPTVIMEATQPIPVVVKNTKTTPLSPVFQPRISVDGRPLPEKKSYDIDDERRPIPTVMPADPTGEETASLKVVSGYSSMAFGPNQQSNTDDPYLADDHVTASLPSRVNTQTSAKNESNSLKSSHSIIDKSHLSKRKSDLKDPFSDPQKESEPEDETNDTILDLVGDERVIESLISKPPVDVRNNTEAYRYIPSTTPSSTSTTNTEVHSSSKISERGNVQTIGKFGTTAPSLEKKASLVLHENPFKREAVDKPLNNVGISDALSYADYEKEDVNLFSFDPPSRDPRIYIDYSEIEAELAKQKKGHGKLSKPLSRLTEIEPYTQEPPVSNKLKKHNETAGTYETVIFDGDVAKPVKIPVSHPIAEKNNPIIRDSILKINKTNVVENNNNEVKNDEIKLFTPNGDPVQTPATLDTSDLTMKEKFNRTILKEIASKADGDDETLSSLPSLTNKNIEDIPQEGHSIMASRTGLEMPVENPFLRTGAAQSTSTEAQDVALLQRSLDLEEESTNTERAETGDDDLLEPDPQPEINSETNSASLNPQPSISSPNTKLISPSLSPSPINESEVPEPPFAETTADSEPAVSDFNESLGPDSPDLIQDTGSPDLADPRSSGSHPEISSSSEEDLVSPPSAAAVAEAAVLTHSSVDRSKDARSLDSRLTADKQIHAIQAPSASPDVASGGPKLSGGVSAARAEVDLGVGVVAAIISGVVVAVLLIVGLGLFVFNQRRSLNRPKALGCDRGYANSDSGGYLDDQCQSSYTTSHLDIPKGCSDDVISLDNDSFLNSLESMTIQNLWTDNIKHTKL
ncbi:uncharacterized protein LOC108673728 [Hyalella azteca]|uniref:Uncharacterized protein LOC108673728 n=1 Tax=Hyalella azteca TaxID=294128 RepID=A0A8B7NTP9_HYAAZ|nr:uncharacterized protein LOC108673728 [Hyalella azteca]